MNNPSFTAENFPTVNGVEPLPPYYSPDAYLAQGPSREYTPGLTYKQIIVPTGGLEQRFFTKVCELLDMSIMDVENHAMLDYIFEQCLQQFGDCYSLNTIQFLHTLNGNLMEGGNVPGYPTNEPFMQTVLCLPDNWKKFVMLFRQFAMDLGAWIYPYTSMFGTFELIYHQRVYGGLAFYLAPKNTIYDL